MLFWSRLSFKHCIQVALFFALFPLTLFSFLVLRTDILAARLERLNDSRAATLTAQQAISESIASTERLLQTLAMLPEVRSGKEDEAYVTIANAMAFYPHLSGFLIAQSDGRVLDRLPLTTPEPVTIRDEPYFRYVMGTGKLYVDYRQDGWISAQPVILIASPIVDNYGQPTGVVATGLSLRKVDEVLASINYEGDLRFLLVDNKGRVTANSGFRHANGGPPVLLPSLAENDGQARDQSIEYKDPWEGNRWLGSALLVPRTTLAVVASYPAAEVEGPFQALFLPYFSAPLAAAILALGLALLLGSVLTLLLRKLSQKTTASVYDALGMIAPKARSDGLASLLAAVDKLEQHFRQVKSELVVAREEACLHSLELHYVSELALRSAESERKRIARDLHDGVIQTIHVALARVRLAGEGLTLRDNAERARGKLREAEITLERTLSEMRGILLDLRPPDLKGMSLAMATYQSLIKSYDSLLAGQCSFEVKGMPFRLPNDTEIAIFRIVQEALSNAAKHAQASRVEVVFEFSTTDLLVSVKDDGLGFDMATAVRRDSRSCGIQNMKERAELIGATLEIKSHPGEGVTVLLKVTPPENRTERVEQGSAIDWGEIVPLGRKA